MTTDTAPAAMETLTRPPVSSALDGPSYAGLVDRSDVTLGRLMERADRVVFGRIEDSSALRADLGRRVGVRVIETVKGRVAPELCFAAPSRGPRYAVGTDVVLFLHAPRRALEREMVVAAGQGALIGAGSEHGVIVLPNDARERAAILAAVRRRAPGIGTGEMRRGLLLELASPVARVAADAAFDILENGGLAAIGESDHEIELLHDAILACAERGVTSLLRACIVAERSAAAELAVPLAEAAWGVASRDLFGAPTLVAFAGAALRALDPDAAARRLTELVVGGGTVAARAAAVRLLGEVGGGTVGWTLGALCGEATPGPLRRAAIKSLSRAAADDPVAIEALVRTMLAGEPGDARVAAAALRSAGGAQATAALRFAAESMPEGDRRRLAEKLLREPDLATGILGRPIRRPRD